LLLASQQGRQPTITTQQPADNSERAFGIINTEAGSEAERTRGEILELIGAETERILAERRFF